MRRTIRVGAAAAAAMLVASCAVLSPQGKTRQAEGPRAAGGPSAKRENKPPETVSEILMISWAEPASKACDTDLEGTAKPAHFTLRYTEKGHEPVTVESSPDKLFAEQWEIVTRSARGLGFEKRTDFSALDFDIAEELRCKCESSKPAEQNYLIKVKLAWRPGAKPDVTANVQNASGAYDEVKPVTINGRLPMWDFHFVRPEPGSSAGECSSRFLVVLGLDQPLE